MAALSTTLLTGQDTVYATVQDYINDARTLLQDTIQPYRYDNPSLLTAFNACLLETRRLRADLFVYGSKRKIFLFANVDQSEVDIEEPFRLAVVMGTVSHALARDQDDVLDERAARFWQSFYSMLTGVTPPPITGGAMK